MIEKIFMAAETNSERGQLSGPYKTAAEAEIQSAILNWGWVVVYTHSVGDDGKITNIEKRFYQPTPGWTPAILEQCKDRLHRTPEQVAQLRYELSTPDPKPLSLSEAAFFEEYERQMETTDGK